MKKVALALGALVTIGFTSCSSDDDNTTNNQLVAPATYEFTREGVSTVDFSGQTTRIAMAQELKNALKDNTLTASQLMGMFAHEAGNEDFSDETLNASNKNIRSKTAASSDYFSTNSVAANAIKSELDAWITEQAEVVFPNWEVTAEAGVAGQIQEPGGGSVRYVNGKGLELNQAVAKALIGGLMADQILNNYLSVNVLDEGDNIANNDDQTLEEGKMYTSMEHKWDEAYGYLYGAEQNPSIPVLDADSYLNTYLNQVDSDEDFTGVAENIFEAFKLGRAAIVAQDYDLRDEQADIIREAVSKVIAVRAVHYFHGGKEAIEANNQAKAFHELSEGFGFMYSLQFTREAGTNAPYFSKEEIDAYVADLMSGNGFWDVSGETLDAIAGEIASRFGFTVEQAAN
ncbi:DUF4856 domain-containing protein [Mangrovimonas aestuarii]|uniref:DUF4856 domain-containing protein n=1 Tax=Mangrovimonas aestuarii TaxID=3018443 RepID=UPI0023784E11|nr:DUF4856 domain-containing protein [Mangrovimonas aestuarii]